MTNFGFHPEARQELLASARYYQIQQSGLGMRFLDAVDSAIARICLHPSLYRLIDKECRQYRIPRFPYGIIYRMREGSIEILAVMHLRRRPGYWQERV